MVKTGKTLAAIVLSALSIFGSCRSSEPDLVITQPKAEARSEEKFKLEQIISALREFTHSYYKYIDGPEPQKQCDLYTIKITERGVELEHLETQNVLNLSAEEILRASYLGARAHLDIILRHCALGSAEMLEKSEIPKELDAYLKRNSLSFKRFNVGMQRLQINYSMRKILEESEIALNLWGTDYKFKITLCGEPIIESFEDYKLKKEGKEKRIFGAAIIKDGEKSIDIYLDAEAAMPKAVYSGIKENKKKLDEYINNLSLLGSHLSEDKISPEFYQIMSRILRYQGLKKMFDSSESIDEFVKEGMVLYRQAAVIEESQHIIDYEGMDFGKMSDKTKFLFYVSTEYRALLARLYHLPSETNKDVLGQCFALIYYPIKDNVSTDDPHAIAADILIKQFLREIIENPKEYPNIGFEKYNASHHTTKGYFSILKQFPNLTPEQLRNFAKKAYDSMRR